MLTNLREAATSAAGTHRRSERNRMETDPLDGAMSQVLLLLHHSVNLGLPHSIARLVV
jgi:hypothetical protein